MARKLGWKESPPVDGCLSTLLASSNLLIGDIGLLWRLLPLNLLMGGVGCAHVHLEILMPLNLLMIFDAIGLFHHGFESARVPNLLADAMVLLIVFVGVVASTGD